MLDCNSEEIEYKKPLNKTYSFVNCEDLNYFELYFLDKLYVDDMTSNELQLDYRVTVEGEIFVEGFPNPTDSNHFKIVDNRLIGEGNQRTYWEKDFPIDGPKTEFRNQGTNNYGICISCDSLMNLRRWKAFSSMCE